MSKRLAVVGESGFVGQAVRNAAVHAGHTVMPVHVRVADPQGLARSSHPADWPARFSPAYEALLHAFKDADAVVNAAGAADAEATCFSSLYAANVVLPGLVARAAYDCGVPRFLHVSSAAVQGRREPLNEEAVWQPFSPYSQSKVDAEKLLLDDSWAYRRQEQPMDIVVYRATSVHGPDRPLTNLLARIATHPVVPVCREGTVPLPVALWHNVGAGIVHAITATDVKGIVLQPDEGITAARLWTAFNPSIRFLNLPLPLAKTGLALFRSFGRLQPKAEAIARRLELLLLGQSLHAEKLRASGFHVRDSEAQWFEFGQSLTTGHETTYFKIGSRLKQGAPE